MLIAANNAVAFACVKTHQSLVDMGLTAMPDINYINEKPVVSFFMFSTKMTPFFFGLEKRCDQPNPHLPLLPLPLALKQIMANVSELPRKGKVCYSSWEPKQVFFNMKNYTIIYTKMSGIQGYIYYMFL